MTELRHDAAWASPHRDTTTERALAAPPLRVVPDLVAPLGEGVLPDEEPLDQELVVRRRVQVTADVVSLVLEPTLPGGVAFRPGQYLTLVVEVDGVPVERCYTISSPPTRPHLLTITVKRVPGGVLSAHLHDRLAVGDRVSARGPLGGFSVASHPARRYLLLSAGSGVTPTLSTLRTMADLGELDGGDRGDRGGAQDGLDVVVLHSGRTPDDLVCRAELDALATAHAGLRVVWICEDDAPGAAARWEGPRGRLSADLLHEHVPDLADREVLTCGPPGYMAAARGLLAALGADPDRCHEESFVLGDRAAPVVPAAAADEPHGGVSPGATVRFGRSDREVACAPGTTVLAAAQQAGVVLPSSCASGLCGTCKSTLLAGKVEMHHQGGIRPREIAQDKFLPCCSTPDGDIVVDA